MSNGTGSTLTIQQVYDQLQQQLQSGRTATLSPVLLPSERLWQLVQDTLDAASITLFPPKDGRVELGPIQGESLTVRGQVKLLNFECGTVVTVTVHEGEPDLAFSLTPPARGWTFGQSFWQMDTRDFNELSLQVYNAAFDWSSAGKSRANAMVFRSDVQLQGIYAVIRNIFADAATTVSWTAPVAFDDNGPNLRLSKPLIESGGGVINIGVVSVKSPFFQAQLRYEEDADNPDTKLPTTQVALGMQLNTDVPEIDQFIFTAGFLGESPTLYLNGRYDDPNERLTLGAVIQALMGSTQPPTLPQPFDTIFNLVGLEYFSAGFSTNMPPELISAVVYVSSKGDQDVWNIYNNQIVLQEIHLSFSLLNASLDLIMYQTTIGGTLKIFDLLFMADVTYTSDGTINAVALLTTADGLPLRFSDILRKLGCEIVAAGIENFFELSFSELGANLTYRPSGGFAYSVHAAADISLRFFGKEFLALHNTYLRWDAAPGQEGMEYAVFASGVLYILGFNLPVSLTLSKEEKVFKVGPISFTLGDIIKFLVGLVHPSWDYQLPAPWNILDSIGFQNLELEFDLNEKTIKLNTGIQADFGFISITNISLVYHLRTPKDRKEGVILALQGTFLGIPIQSDDPDEPDALSWDLVNGKPPEVPGGGEQLFYLEYLGVGQHISFRETRQLKTVSDVITAMEQNFRPGGDPADPLAKMNGLVFNENSGWLIGSKFTVMEAVTLSLIFNDPVLYGLRVTLGGPKVQGLDGLAFEILYKRITDSIGLFHIDLRLPDAIRHLEFGEVSIQIPEFVLDIYTNGNFKVDVGFPYNNNFERSVAVEVFPFVGLGGFYFGYLQSATSDNVPVIDNGTFDPVLELGLGLSLGVGKTIDAGILHAGATLTAIGILEGVLAWFNPSDTHQDTAMYFSLKGSLGIVGRVYGEIDFAIIKASVDISASAIVSFAIASYQPIHLGLNITVSAKVKVKILFISISLSFRIEIDLEWTIGHAGTPPWHVVSAAPGRDNLALARHGSRLTGRGPARRRRALRTLAAAAAPLITFAAERARRAVQDGPTTDIALTFSPFFSQSNTPSLANGDAPGPYAQRVRIAPMLLTANTDADPNRDPIFQRIGDLMFRRIVDARLQEKPPAERGRVSLYDLAVIHTQLAAGLLDPNFSYEALQQYFTSNNIRFVIQAGLSESQQGSTLHGTLLPMIPALTLTDSQSSDTGKPIQRVAVNYTSDSRFMVDAEYEQMVNEYFASFKVNGQSALEQSTQPQFTKPPRRAGATESMACFIFRDYFLMVTRSMVDNAITYMESYPCAVGASPESLAEIAARMAAEFDVFDEDPTPLTIAYANQSTTGILQTFTQQDAPAIANVLYQARQGDCLQAVAAMFNTTAALLVDQADPKTEVPNSEAPYMLTVGAKILLGDITYTAGTGESNLQSVSIFFSVDPQRIVDDPANQGLDFSKPFPPGTRVHVPGASYVIQAADTLKAIAVRYATTTTVLADLNQADTAMLAALGVWAIPPIHHPIAATDTLLGISQKYCISMEQLLDGGYQDARIIRAGVTITVPYRPEMDVTELYQAMNTAAVTDPIAANVSRFMLYGLRLPQYSPIDFGHMNPLYNLIGQQISVPSDVLTTTCDYDLTLKCDPPQSWVAFASIPPTEDDSCTYHLSDADREELKLFAQPFTADAVTVQQMPLMAYSPNRYSLEHVIHWQSPTGLDPIISTGAGAAGEPNIWMFPDTLRNRLTIGPSPEANGLRAAAVESGKLQFRLSVGRQEKPNTPVHYDPVENFAWGTMIELQIKQVMSGDFSDQAVSNDYLMVGADPAGRDLLYQLWMYMSGEGKNDPAALYILFSSDPARQGAQGVASDRIDAAQTELLKTNLSTTSTQPGLRLAVGDAVPQYHVGIGAAADFIKLLWECSTVNTGGYYLKYVTAGDGLGLPDTLFDQDRNGTIQLLVIFASQKQSGGPTKQPAILKTGNCGILTDHLDLSNAQLVVEAASYTVSQGQSLEQVRQAMQFPTMADLAAVNGNIKLLVRVGYTFTVNGRSITAQPGDSLYSMAQRAGTTPVAVADALAAAGDALIPGAMLQYASGQLQLGATGPLGSAGFTLQRANPDPDDLPNTDLTSQQELNLLFNLLGWDIGENDFFAPKAMFLPDGTPAGRAAEGVPIGPVEPENVDEATRKSLWVYNRILQYYSFALPAGNACHDVPHLPVATGNPYAGIVSGAHIDFTFNYQDMFGNRTDPATAIPALSIPVGYRDPLTAFSAWPGITCAYWIRSSEQPVGGVPYKVLAQLQFGFRVAGYVSGNGQNQAQAEKRRMADSETLGNIYYQFLQPDLQPLATCSLDAVAGTDNPLPADYFLNKAALGDTLDSALLYLAALAQTAQKTITTAAGDTIGRLASTWLLAAPGALPEENGAMPVNKFFDLSGSGPDDDKLLIPLILVSAASDTLRTLAERAHGIPGVDPQLTPEQLLTMNAAVPLTVGVLAVVPSHPIPPTGQPAIADESLAAVAQKYACTTVGLATDNAERGGILRAGTSIVYNGLHYVITSGDTFRSLTENMQTITVPAAATIRQAAESRLMTVGALAFANETEVGVWKPDAVFTYEGIQVTVKAGESLYDIAGRFSAEGKELTVEQLAVANQDTPGLMNDNAKLKTGLYNVLVSDVALANADLPAIFRPGAALVSLGRVVQAGESAQALVTMFQAIDPTYDLAKFCSANQATVGLFPAGTPLLVGEARKAPAKAETLSEFVKANTISFNQLAEYNLDRALAAATLKIPERTEPDGLTMAAASVPAGGTLTAMAGLFYGDTTQAAKVVQTNFAMWRTLVPGLTVNLAGHSAVTRGDDTFTTLWNRLQPGVTPDYATLAAAVDSARALRGGAVLQGPTATAGADSRPETLAAAWNVGVDDLLDANKSLSGFLKPGVAVPFRKPDGSAVSVTTRDRETINTFYPRVTAAGVVISMENYRRVLAVCDGLIPRNARFVTPPARGSVTTVVNKNFPGKIFPLTLNLDLARVNFKVTTDTIAQLKTIPDVPPAEADKLAPLAAEGTTFINGDEFDARLRTLFSPTAQVEYLITLTRRFSALPTVLLDPTFRDVYTVSRAATQLPAYTESSGTDSGLLSLRPFAAAFESAFRGEVKAGASPGKSGGDTSTAPRRLWAVDFSASGFGFAIERAKPTFFAPTPLSTSLKSASGVPMRWYVSGNSTPQDGAPVEIKSADLDAWAAQFFQTLDLTLTPAYAVPLCRMAPSSFETLVGIKKELAKKVGGKVANVLADPPWPGDVTAAQKAFTDRLMIALSDAYRIDTILQYPLDVTRGGQSPAETAPRLVGQPGDIAYVTADPAVPGQSPEMIDTMARAVNVSQEYLVSVIRTMPGILNTGGDTLPPVTVVYTPSSGPTREYLLQTGDTLQSAAVNGLGLSSAFDLINHVGVKETGRGLFTPALSINITPVSYTPSAPCTCEGAAFYFDASVADMATAVQDVKSIFNPQITSITYDGRTLPVPPGATLRDMAVQFEITAAQLASYLRLEPGLLAQGVTLNMLTVLPNYTLSSAKAAMAQGGSDLTFFLNVASEARQKKLFMNLDYVINQMEYDITAYAGDPGYQNSSWINFILPFDSAAAGMSSNIGQTEIPLVLRAYPDLPIIPNQSGIPTPITTPDPPLTTLKQWDYQVEMGYREAAQDILYTSLLLNDVAGAELGLDRASLRSRLRATDDSSLPRNLLDALAQFSANLTALQQDLGLLPAMGAGAVNQAVSSAVAVFTEFAGRILEHWDQALAMNATLGNGSIVRHDYLLLTLRQRQDPRYLDSLIVKSIAADEEIWPGVVEVKVNDTWIALTPVPPQPGTEERVFTYPPQVPADNQLEHRYRYQYLDVVRFQSAGSAMQIKRNEQLISAGRSNPAFIYQTPVISTTNMLTPLITRQTRFNLESTALAQALGDFFRKLFGIGTIPWPAGATRLIKLHAVYIHDLLPTPEQAPVAVPVVLYPQYTFRLDTDYKTDPGTFTSNLAAFVETWASTYLQPGATGGYRFTVTVFEDKTDHNPSPVLELQDIHYTR